MFGFLAALPAILGGIGRVAGGAAQGSANQRTQENQQALQRSQLLAQLYGVNQNATQRALESGSDERLRQGGLDLNQRQFQQGQREFALQAPSVRGRQAVKGSLMANLQPFSVSGLPDRVQSRIPQLSGGLSPAAFSPEMRQMGQMLQRDAILGQLKGDPVDTFAPQTPTDFSSGVLTPPQIAELEKSGLLEKILGGTGLIGSLLGSLGESRPRQQTNYPIDPIGGG